MSSTQLIKRFAPLRDSLEHSEGLSVPVLKGVVFDMDGTLCKPQSYMFGQMRQALGIAKDIDILDHIESLALEQKLGALDSIKAIEREAMKSQTPQPGLNHLMDYLDSRGIRKAICTRNFNVPVQNLLDNFLKGSIFKPIITRDFKPPKPDPAGILHIAKDWGLVDEDGAPDASGVIMVGDSIDDMAAGRAAGAVTVLLVNNDNEALSQHEHTDLTISTLDELAHILEQGFKSREIQSS